MTLKGIVSKGLVKASEIMGDGETYTVFNFINHEERIVSISWKSKNYKTLRGAIRYCNKFLDNSK